MGNKIESKPKTEQIKAQPQVEPKAQIKASTQAETPVQVVQLKPQTSSKPKIDDLKLDTKKLSLIFHQVAKQSNSIFTEEQKFRVRLSFVGVFVSLTTATLINMSQLIFQPAEKHKKWFIITGAVNLFGSVILAGYGIYHVIDLSTKVSEAQWARIQAEKAEYDKLTFSQRKELFTKKPQEKKSNLKTLVLNQKQQELSQRQQEKIDLLK